MNDFTLSGLQKLARAIEVKSGFTDCEDHGRALMLIVSELAEALEEVRNGRSPTEIYYNADKPTKPEGFPIELADAMIRIAGTAQRLGIDLTEACRLKCEYNSTRPYKHGKAF